MSEVLQQVETAVNQRRLLPHGSKVLVAVSGGVDSMVLLHWLHAQASENRWQLSLAHFNHQLRGRASDADEQLVRRTAERLLAPLFCERGAVAEYARQAKISVEMAARRLRHEFLARTARVQNIRLIALAHHADDQVELFFLRLLRGAGGEGLGGMKWRSPSPADKTITLVRPLLDCAKAELLAIAHKSRIRFREDATNDSTDFLRNRVRNELLPLLQKNYQPGLAKTVLRVMAITGAEAEFASETAQQWLARVGASRFDRLPVAVQRKVLQAQLIQLGSNSDFDLIEQLRATAGKHVSVSSDVAIARAANGKLACRQASAAKFNLGELELDLSGRAGDADFGGQKFQWNLRRFAGAGIPPVRPAQTELFDADQVGGKVVLRHWRAGDRFQPIGLRAAAKLQDLFVNAKIPVAQRRNLVLATTAAGEIFWVAGLRMGERFKLTPATRRMLVWKWTVAEIGA